MAIKESLLNIDSGTKARFLKIGMIAIVVVGLCLVYSMIHFKGLGTEAAMDQAQIARSLANSEGFSTRYIRPLAIRQLVDSAKKVPSGNFPDFVNAPLFPLLEAVVLALGVSVTVQVMPPSPVMRLDKTAFGADKSAVVKPVTASVKVNVTVAVSPIFSAVSLIVMLLVCSVAGWLLLFPLDLQAFGQSLVASTGFVANISFWLQSGYFDTASDLKPLLHTWSLAVEEQFYLFFPLVLLVANSTNGSVNVDAVGILTVGSGNVVAKNGVTLEGSNLTLTGTTRGACSALSMEAALSMGAVPVAAWSCEKPRSRCSP
jgi:hypothetical protein